MVMLSFCSVAKRIWESTGPHLLFLKQTSNVIWNFTSSFWWPPATLLLLPVNPPFQGGLGHFLSSQKVPALYGFSLPTSHEENDKTGCGEVPCSRFPHVACEVFSCLPSLSLSLFLEASIYSRHAGVLWVLTEALIHIKKKEPPQSWNGSWREGSQLGPGACLTLKHTA